MIYNATEKKAHKGKGYEVAVKQNQYLFVKLTYPFRAIMFAVYRRTLLIYSENKKRL